MQRACPSRLPQGSLLVLLDNAASLPGAQSFALPEPVFCYRLHLSRYTEIRADVTSQSEQVEQIATGCSQEASRSSYTSCVLHHSARGWAQLAPSGVLRKSSQPQPE